MSLEHTPCPQNMQTCKFNNDIIPFQVTFRGLQLVSQLYLPTKWPWIARISSGNYDEVVITTPLPYHCMISPLYFPILGRQRLGQPILPALEQAKRQVGFNPISKWDSNPANEHAGRAGALCTAFKYDHIGVRQQSTGKVSQCG